MSGPFGSSQWMYSSGGFYPKTIGQSLRFNDDDSAYLSRTPASAGNRKTWTWSGWVKRGNLGSAQTLLGANTTFVEFTSADKIQFDHNGTTVATSAVFRDPSAWYHVVVAVDTTQATAADRTEIYVNGTIQAVTGSYVSQNTDTDVNNATQHNIGANLTPAEYFDGYMAEVNFIDGSALDPTSFGEFKSDIWVPKEYTGSYGTNGFYLSFADSANIGDDLSGNTNDWTANNLVSTDVLLDSPTNNYAVLNPLDKNSVITTADGNLSYTSSNDRIVKATFSMASGKWYWEFSPGGGGSTSGLGVINPSVNIYAVVNLNIATAGVSYLGSGNKSINGTSTAYGTSYTSGDVIGVALDLDADEVTFYKNNVSQGAISLTSGLEWFPAFDQNIGTNAVNFGQSPFAYTPPSGFLPLNTANLPAPAIDPAEDDVPADYFNTVLYTGDGVSPRSITGVGFQPDLNWIKARSVAYDALIADGVRGAGQSLTPSSTAAETTNNANGYLSAFDADGFTLTQGASSMVSVNESGQTYVAWNWLAGNGTSSNTDGTITSTVSVNQKAGFSIVGWTGTGGGADTIGHGLGAPPKMVITKTRTASTAYNWNTYHFGTDASAPEDWFVALNSTAARTSYTAANLWNRTQPTSLVFSVNNVAAAGPLGDAMIAYCFAEVEGYSKFGSYTGNGSTDGPFVYCGFRPAFVMFKRTDSTGEWMMVDDARQAFNSDTPYLDANSSAAESTASNEVDFLSNGFKLRSAGGRNNASGGTYIFAAFAEQPVKFSNAR